MKIVILCGGSGTRLWPESRESLPKQFIKIFNEKSLLDLTIERMLSLNINSKPIFISNKKHGFLVKKSIDKYKLDADLILEPEGKNTCAAIYLAAKHSQTKENLLIMPSDHLIPNKNKFSDDIANINKSMNKSHWVTLGVKPTRPAQDYGYILVNKEKNNNFFNVSKFIEKPPEKTAFELIKNNLCYWNAGIFLGNTSMILNSIKCYEVSVAKKCDIVYENVIKNKNLTEFNFSAEQFSQIPSKSIDYAVMEKESNIHLYPFEDEWSDVGSWDAISEIFKKSNSNKKVFQIGSKNNFIRSPNRVVATIGVKDLIIVENNDATLICKKNQTNKVKNIVNKINKQKIIQGKEHSFEHRPWGKFSNLYEDEFCKVKRIVVDPKKRLSLQYHNYRSEHWLVVEGTADIHLDGKFLQLKKGQSVDIPIKANHFIENKTNRDLIIIETQLGTYFGEDDIIRLDDPYSR